MQSVFRTFVVIWVFLTRTINLSNNIMKPTFFPYCTTKDRCQPACTCEVYPNCVLLSMDETTRYSILYYHNQIRDIQTLAEPQPAGMTKLEYDMELEEISICWASRCDDEYSECFLTPKFAETSQSVVQIILDAGQEPNVFLWMQVMNEWLGQVKTMTAEIISSLPAGQQGEKLNNYVQLMSDRILAVGCAWSQLNNVLTLVCTYGPRGPLQGEPVYIVGSPCTNCPVNYACDNVKPFEQLCKLKAYPELIPPPQPPPTPTGSQYPPAAIPPKPGDILPPVPDYPDWSPQPPPLPHLNPDNTVKPQIEGAPTYQPEYPVFPHFPTDPPLRQGEKSCAFSEFRSSCSNFQHWMLAIIYLFVML